MPRSMIVEEFLAVVGDAAAGAAEREGGADDRRQADCRRARRERLGSSVVAPGCERGVARPIVVHRLAEQLAVFGLVDGFGGGADHLDVVVLQTPIFFSDSAQFSAVCPPMVGSSAKPPGHDVALLAR